MAEKTLQEQLKELSPQTVRGNDYIVPIEIDSNNSIVREVKSSFLEGEFLEIRFRGKHGFRIYEATKCKTLEELFKAHPLKQSLFYGGRFYILKYLSKKD